MEPHMFGIWKTKPQTFCLRDFVDFVNKVKFWFGVTWAIFKNVFYEKAPI